MSHRWFLVHMSDCVDKTPDYVENQAFLDGSVQIQAYS